jgi:anti-sigma factor RsiW
MKCDEVQPLQGTYLDSELDARTTLEIEQHLGSCPECVRFFAEQVKLEGRLKAGLNQGRRTAALWEQIERSVAAAASTRSHPESLLRLSPPGGWRVILTALVEQLGFGRSRGAWAALAAVWIVILALNFTADENVAGPIVRKDAPTASAIRFALKQRQLLMAEFPAASELAPADKPKTTRPSPRSDRRQQTLNT